MQSANKLKIDSVLICSYFVIFGALLVPKCDLLLHCIYVLFAYLYTFHTQVNTNPDVCCKYVRKLFIRQTIFGHNLNRIRKKCVASATEIRYCFQIMCAVRKRNAFDYFVYINNFAFLSSHLFVDQSSIQNRSTPSNHKNTSSNHHN